MSEEVIVNKVQQNKKLVTIDLQKFHDPTPLEELDIKQFLFQEMLLKEKDFREQLKEFDWSQYEGKNLCVYCSTDAIIAPWAWMLITSYAGPFANEVFLGKKEAFLHQLYQRKLEEYDWDQYEDKFVLLKGCGKVHVPDSIYILATNKLMGTAKKIMYGEACSNVPVWRR
ncbi:DUF2480 family protein [Gracilimonas halophila]|uniref:DUF2480 family protein n=1 Tax=Gracilimonas halophila TaxID=1834464 RepID=A0ABW5JL10_9BACT